jgi:hypothetical protein
MFVFDRQSLENDYPYTAALRNGAVKRSNHRPDSIVLVNWTDFAGLDTPSSHPMGALSF